MKVLIVGHFWPYRGGSCRMPGLAKYLPEFGWEPIIITAPLTRKPEIEVRYIETGHRNILGVKTPENLSDQLKVKSKRTPVSIKNFLRFCFRIFKQLFAFPDEDKNWKPFAILEIEKLLKKEKIDAIISVWPVTSHLIAKKIKEKYNIPWIADFPDLWSLNHNYSYGKTRRKMDQMLEKSTLKKADSLVTIAAPFSCKMKELHNRKDIYTITHGFDPDIINDGSTPLTKKFTITYTGQIYGKQNPLKVLEAIKRLIDNDKINPNEIEIRLYGPEIKWLNIKIKELKLDSIFKYLGLIERKEVFKKQRESQVLLKINWEDPNQKASYTGKIFEYLAAKRPILATGGFKGDITEKMLQTTKAGVFVADEREIEEAIFNFYQEYKKNGFVQYKGNWQEVKKYSHKQMVKSFSDLLNNVCVKKTLL